MLKFAECGRNRHSGTRSDLVKKRNRIGGKIMERKFLEELGLEKEAIDKIMAENGKDIEAQKALTLAESEKLKKATETISQLQDTVKQFDGVDVEKLKSDVATYLKKRPTEAMLSKGGDGKGLFVMHNTQKQ